MFCLHTNLPPHHVRVFHYHVLSTGGEGEAYPALSRDLKFNSLERRVVICWLLDHQLHQGPLQLETQHREKVWAATEVTCLLCMQSSCSCVMAVPPLLPYCYPYYFICILYCATVSISVQPTIWEPLLTEHRPKMPKVENHRIKCFG